MEKHKALHMATEALALFLTVPLALRLAAQQGPLTDTQRKHLYMYAVGTLLIDGYLLVQWLRR
jgi:hypothetical protein